VHKVHHDTLRRMEELRADGKTYDEIGAAMAFHPVTVGKRLRKMAK
jgi:hypothetical protein